MAETKVKVALEAAGWKVGDVAYWGSVLFGDEHDSMRDFAAVGLFRKQADAKRAVAAEVTRREVDETREGWWSGGVSEGTIDDRSFDDGAFGWISSWEFEVDDTKPAVWFAAGEWES